MRTWIAVVVLALCTGCGTPARREPPKEIRVEMPRTVVCGVELVAGHNDLTKPLPVLCLGSLRALGCEHNPQQGRYGYGLVHCDQRALEAAIAATRSQSSYYFSYQSGPGVFGGPTFFFETMLYRPYPRACPPFGHQC